MAVDGTTVTAAVRVNRRDKTISNVERTGGLVTITTTADHGYAAGEKVEVEATTNTDVNGTFMIESVPDTDVFTYRQYERDRSTPDGISSGSDTGSTIEHRTVVFANGVIVETDDADHTVHLPVEMFYRLNSDHLGAAPALFTDVT